ncbi:MAG: hypothetical protein JNG84_05225 [Archangium sp.]|nr:hypothetical protein [Archangium sp.]
MSRAAGVLIGVVVSACVSGPLPDVVFRCEADRSCSAPELACGDDGWCRAPQSCTPWQTGCPPIGLSPLQLTTPCEGWWRWKTGVVRDDGGRVTRWEDQSSYGRHFDEIGESRRPGYDLERGAIVPDGFDDILRLSDAPTAADAELTFVIERPEDTRGTLFSFDASSGVDADAVAFVVDAAGLVHRTKATSINREISTESPPVPALQPTIISVTPESVFIDGVAATYTARERDSHSVRSRGLLFARVSNRSPTTELSNSPSNIALREFMWHRRALPPEDRDALIAALKARHGIAQ